MPTSKELLDRLSPEGKAIIEGPGTPREKLAKLRSLDLGRKKPPGEGDLDLFEEALIAAGNEVSKIVTLLERSESEVKST